MELEQTDSCALLEWFANNYKKKGATLEIVTDRSQEGSQFVKGFGGIGGRRNKDSKMILNLLFSGLLRYRLDFQTLGEPEDDDFYEDY